MSAVLEIAITPNNCINDPPACPGNPGVARTRVKLMDTATRTSPVSVTATPANTGKSCSKPQSLQCPSLTA